MGRVVFEAMMVEIEEEKIIQTVSFQGQTTNKG